MAFMLGNHLTFIDSFQFMSSSLDKLASNLPNQTSDILQHSQNRPTGDRWLKFKIRQSRS